MIFNIDIDDTVNNFIERFVELFNSITHEELSVRDILCYDLTKLGIDRETLETLFFKNNYFYEALKPLDDSVSTINLLLAKKHDIRFVTAIDYDVIQARLDFIRHYFPYIDTSKSLIVTNNKRSIYADYVIDDLQDNLNNVNDCCTYFLKMQPWNKDYVNDLIAEEMKFDKKTKPVYIFDNWFDLRMILSMQNLI